MHNIQYNFYFLYRNCKKIDISVWKREINKEFKNGVKTMLNNFKENSWSRIGELLFLTESKFLFHPTRIETNSIIITDVGEKEEKMGIDFIYSISQLESIFNKTGFQLKEIYSIPGKKRFTVGEPRAYIVAEKI